NQVVHRRDVRSGNRSAPNRLFPNAETYGVAVNQKCMLRRREVTGEVETQDVTTLSPLDVSVMIISFLRPIRPLLRPGYFRHFGQRFGPGLHREIRRLGQALGFCVSERALQIAIRNIARTLGDEVGPEQPLLDARLPDGSRLAAVLPPCSIS